MGTIGDGYSGGQSVNIAGELNDNNIGGGGDSFGFSVSLEGTALAVGIANDQGPPETCNECGAVFLFNFSDVSFNGGLLTTRIGHDYFGPNDIDLNLSLDVGDNFGSYVSLDNGRLAVGAVADDGQGACCDGAGSVYLFTLGGGASTITIPQATFGFSPGSNVTIGVTALTTILNAGTSLVLQANNDITILADIFVNNPLGTGGDLTLQAGRSVIFNADIETDGGDLTVIANDSPSAGVIGTHRDAGAAEIFMASGASIDTSCKPVSSCYGDVRLTIGSDTLKANHATGDITLQTIVAGSLIAENLGPSAGDVIIRNQIDAFDAGPAVILASLFGDFRNQNTPLGQSVLSTPNGHWLIYSQSHGESLFGPLLGRQRSNVPYNPSNPAGGFNAPPPSPFDGILAFRKSPPGLGTPPTRISSPQNPKLKWSIEADFDSRTLLSEIGGVRGLTQKIRNNDPVVSAQYVARRIVDFVQLAFAVYGTAQLPDGYQIASTYVGTDGFLCTVYFKDGKAVLVFRGTDDWFAGFKLSDDGRTNVQHLSSDVVSNQQEQALSMADKIIQAYGKDNVTVVGYSLGGNLAQYVGMRRDVGVIAVNSAPMRTPAVPLRDNILVTGLSKDPVHQFVGTFNVDVPIGAGTTHANSTPSVTGEKLYETQVVTLGHGGTAYYFSSFFAPPILPPIAAGHANSTPPVGRPGQTNSIVIDPFYYHYQVPTLGTISAMAHQDRVTPIPITSCGVSCGN